MRGISMTNLADDFAPQERDLKMVYAAMACGALTAEQFARLFFSFARVTNKKTGVVSVQVSSQCELRLKKLKDYGLLRRVEQYQTPKEGKRPYLYAATRKGAQIVARWLECDVHDLPYRQKDSRVSSVAARHLIGENDVRVALQASVRDTDGVTLPIWLDGITLKSTHSADKLSIQGPHGGSQTAVLVPDDYFVLQVAGKDNPFHHFVEIDMGTEVGSAREEWQQSWARKIRLYNKYFEGGLNSLVYKRYKTFRARVLTVTTSETRLENLLQVTEKTGGEQRFWFSTFDRIEAANNTLFAPVWQLAKMNRDELKPLLERPAS